MGSPSYPKIIVEGPSQAGITTVKVSFPEVMVHGQFNGICWLSSSMASQLGGRFADFCGIYSLVKFSMEITIKQGMILVAFTVLRLSFQMFGCAKFFPIQKLPGGR